MISTLRNLSLEFLQIIFQQVRNNSLDDWEMTSHIELDTSMATKRLIQSQYNTGSRKWIRRPKVIILAPFDGLKEYIMGAFDGKRWLNLEQMVGNILGNISYCREQRINEIYDQDRNKLAHRAKAN